MLRTWKGKSIIQAVKKATPKGSIPVKIFKWNSDIIAPVLREFYNQNIKNSTFPNELKIVNIYPVYKKKDRHDKSNYRPVSIVPLLSKPFERILYEQIDNHTKDILSKYQRVFRKNLSSQHSLLALFEKWEKVLDNGRSWGALLIFQKLWLYSLWSFTGKTKRMWFWL